MRNFDWDIAVCTIEKAVVLINRLLEEERMNELGCLCIDELHMIGDAQRGYLIELMVMKLKYLNSNVQILGFSATIPNLEVFSKWLGASLYSTNFRPIKVNEFIKVNESVFDKNMKLIRIFTETREEDPDHLIPLCWDIIREGKSVLIFCPTKVQTQKTALLIAKLIVNTVDEDILIHRRVLITALGKCPCGLDPDLNETILSGIGFHHSGLTLEERELIEKAFRKGVLLILVATCTLSMGVNLPARRVIFRSPYISKSIMNSTEYKQMSGRAGRKGKDILGESVIICVPRDLEKIKKIVNSTLPPVLSCLSQEPQCMVRSLLDAISTGLVKTVSDLKKYIECSLLSLSDFQGSTKSPF
ncbi:hypothetical protein HMI56_001721 [Coelomomyces lativittatus]|nr:hypothetical protein HMI56_001721 [Coelomomyces lativittatus]